MEIKLDLTKRKQHREYTEMFEDDDSQVIINITEPRHSIKAQMVYTYIQDVDADDLGRPFDCSYWDFKFVITDGDLKYLLNDTRVNELYQCEDPDDAMGLVKSN